MKTGLESLDTGAPNITYSGNEGPKSPQENMQKMAEFELQEYMEEFERVFPDMKNLRGTEEYMNNLEDYFRGLASKQNEGIGNMATMDSSQQSTLEDIYERLLDTMSPEDAAIKAKEIFENMQSKQDMPSEMREMAAGGGIMGSNAGSMLVAPTKDGSRPGYAFENTRGRTSSSASTGNPGFGQKQPHRDIISAPIPTTTINTNPKGTINPYEISEGGSGQIPAEQAALTKAINLSQKIGSYVPTLGMSKPRNIIEKTIDQHPIYSILTSKRNPLVSKRNKLLSRYDTKNPNEMSSLTEEEEQELMELNRGIRLDDANMLSQKEFERIMDYQRPETIGGDNIPYILPKYSNVEIPGQDTPTDTPTDTTPDTTDFVNRFAPNTNYPFADYVGGIEIPTMAADGGRIGYKNGTSDTTPDTAGVISKVSPSQKRQIEGSQMAENAYNEILQKFYERFPGLTTGEETMAEMIAMLQAEGVMGTEDLGILGLDRAMDMITPQSAEKSSQRISMGDTQYGDIPYAQGGRIGYAGGGITDLRQGYFLGKLVKKAVRGVKKIVKSPVGKAALLAGAVAFGPSLLSGLKMGFAGTQGPLQASRFMNLARFGRKAGEFAKNVGPMKGILALSSLPLFMGQEEEEDNLDAITGQAVRGQALDIPGIRKQVLAGNLDRSMFPFMNSSYYKADGGRIGLAEGLTPRQAALNQMYEINNEDEEKKLALGGSAGLPPVTMMSEGQVSQSFSDDETPMPTQPDQMPRPRPIMNPMMAQRMNPMMNRGMPMMGGRMMAQEGGIMMASVDDPFYRGGEEDDHSFRMFGKPYKELNADELEEFREEMIRLMNKFSSTPMPRPDRVMAQEGGLMDMGGMEKDYRNEGGFVPIGGQERADDVPARLSKNEFVFTADAVRNAGGGDIDKGAEIMENMMDNLEQGGKVSKDSQGLEGAREMFATQKRLGEVL